MVVVVVVVVYASERGLPQGLALCRVPRTGSVVWSAFHIATIKAKTKADGDNLIKQCVRVAFAGACRASD